MMRQLRMQKTAFVAKSQICRNKKKHFQDKFIGQADYNSYLCIKNLKNKTNMALTAVLEFGDNTIQRYSKRYLVADCKLIFNRPYNAFCPQGVARCERIELAVVAPGKEDLGMFEWFTKQSLQDGRLMITMSGGSQDTPDTQTLYFYDAKCFSLSEYYDINSSNRRLIKLAVGAEIIQIEDVTIERI